PVALTALGIFGAVLMIFAGLLALNHTVLPFDGWPLNNDRLGTERQVLPRAPAETGRLRTATGGTPPEANDGSVVIPGGSAPADAATDTDGDGLTNKTEFKLKDNPQNADSNGDGTPDGVDDADQDGVPNEVEQTLTTDPNASDSNHDGKPDGSDDPDGDGLP